MDDKPDESAASGGPEQVDSAGLAQAGQISQAQLQELAALRAENAELRDRLLRNMAEMENSRRRSERDKTDGMKYAISEFARDAVSLGDNLRRAIEAARKEPLEGNPALRTLVEGVEVTERELFKVFERHGITRFDPMGEKFDPHWHEAMVKVDVPGVPADIVVQVLQAGYKLADRVLRPAAVIVAKGGTLLRPDRKPPENPSAGNTAADAGNEGGSSGPASYGAPPDTAHDHGPDVIRSRAGAPRAPQGQSRNRDQPAMGERQRTPSVARPVTEDGGPCGQDDLASTFGKRLDNGS